MWNNRDYTANNRDCTRNNSDCTANNRDCTLHNRDCTLNNSDYSAGNLDYFKFYKYNFRTQSRFRVEVAGLQTVCRLNFEDAGNEIPPFSVLRARHLLIQRNR